MSAISRSGFKAQFTMKVLLEIGLLLIVFAQIYPTLIEPPLANLTEPTDPAYVGDVPAALLSLLPFVIVCIIILGVISFNLLGGRRI